VKSKVAAKKWLCGRLIAKILITTIQANLCCLLHVSLRNGTKFTWIVVIEIFAINLPAQPFLGRHIGFHIFFTVAFFGAAHFFYSWAVFGLDFISFCKFMLHCHQWLLLLVFFVYKGRYGEFYMCTMHTYYLIKINFAYIYILYMSMIAG